MGSAHSTACSWFSSVLLSKLTHLDDSETCQRPWTPCPEFPEPGPDDSCNVTLFVVPLPHFHLCHITNGGGIPQTTWSPFKLVQGTNLNFARLSNFLAIFMICVALMCTRAEPEEVSWTRPLYIKRTTGCRNSNGMLICVSLQLCLAAQTCILGRGLWGGMLSSWMSVQRQGTVLFTWEAVLILPGPVWFTSDPSSAQREACYSMFWYFLAWIISLYAFFVYLGPKMP